MFQIDSCLDSNIYILLGLPVFYDVYTLNFLLIGRPDVRYLTNAGYTWSKSAIARGHFLHGYIYNGVDNSFVFFCTSRLHENSW